MGAPVVSPLLGSSSISSETTDDSSETTDEIEEELTFMEEEQSLFDNLRMGEEEKEEEGKEEVEEDEEEEDEEEVEDDDEVEENLGQNLDIIDIGEFREESEHSNPTGKNHLIACYTRI